MAVMWEVPYMPNNVQGTRNIERFNREQQYRAYSWKSVPKMDVMGLVVLKTTPQVLANCSQYHMQYYCECRGFFSTIITTHLS